MEQAPLASVGLNVVWQKGTATSDDSAWKGCDSLPVLLEFMGKGYRRIHKLSTPWMPTEGARLVFTMGGKVVRLYLLATSLRGVDVTSLVSLHFAFIKFSSSGLMSMW